ncbi:MAG: gliding motility-associated C-terminal domain-containing protein, partial [Bacteroidota bacterium]
MSRIKAFIIILLFICFASVKSYSQIDGITIKDSTYVSEFEHFLFPMKIVSGDTLNFDADTANYSFNWSVDGASAEPEYNTYISNNDTIPYFKQKFESSDTYEVTLEIINDTSGISYFANINISTNNNIEVPNVFTPDGDGKNDLFVVKSSGDTNNKLKLLIYTRNGDLIYEKIAPVVYWDGKLASGDYAQEGVYYYIV